MYFGQQMFNLPNPKAHTYLQVDVQREYTVYYITYKCNIYLGQ